MPRKSIPCRICGEPCYVSKGSSPQPAHRFCKAQEAGIRDANGERVHGTEVTYNKGRCRCQPCRDAATERMRDYMTRRKHKDGKSYWTGHERRTSEYTCQACGKTFARRQPQQFCSRQCFAVTRRGPGYTEHDDSRNWIARADRLAIYTRDDWTCQLCGDPIDRDAHFLDDLAATLDHIECRSWVLIPDHSPSNLRTAHRICNSRRADQPDWEPLTT